MMLHLLLVARAQRIVDIGGEVLRAEAMLPILFRSKQARHSFLTTFTNHTRFILFPHERRIPSGKSSLWRKRKSRILARPRLRRDLTVPSDTDVASAISS